MVSVSQFKELVKVAKKMGFSNNNLDSVYFDDSAIYLENNKGSVVGIGKIWNLCNRLNNRYDSSVAF